MVQIDIGYWCILPLCSVQTCIYVDSTIDGALRTIRTSNQGWKLNGENADTKAMYSHVLNVGKMRETK